MTPQQAPLPPPRPAPSDLYCWLHAAYPLTDAGSLPLPRVAADLNVSRTVVRRWLAAGNTEPLTKAQHAYLHRRAILRGRGTYLWPLIGAETAYTLDRALTYAEHCLTLVDDSRRMPATWRTDKTLTAHWVVLLHYPRAHVYGIATGRTDKHHAKLSRHADVITIHPVANRHAATVAKLRTLRAHRSIHCTTPIELVPTGRTETWRELPGPADTTIRT